MIFILSSPPFGPYCISPPPHKCTLSKHGFLASSSSDGSSVGSLTTLEKDEADGSEGQEDDEGIEWPQQRNRSFSECYFAVKGAALVLPHDECMHVYRRSSTNAGDIQHHLQSMFYLMRPEDTLKMAVKLESVHVRRTRYLVVVSCQGRQNTEESCLLGIDCNNNTTIGLVLPVWADTRITLDGDGGFSVSANGRYHIFKPVSVQAMWSALQTLHKASAKAREYTYFPGGGTHQWVEYYEQRVTSDRSCLNEWYAMDDLVSRRPPSPDTDRSKPTEVEATQQLIRSKLKELMMSVDLDDVTSKEIRTRLEEEVDMNLNDYKSFIDQEMLVILGQMDSPTEIFEYLYLGSEWNASNLDELKVKGVGHILNVTREIDNFFPGMFDYLNVRVYDDESTEMLQYWDKTYKYIRKAKDKGSKVLVHCKMGISRSASVVIAYVMKAYDWNLEKALKFVRNKRNCIKPNENFLKQLEIYQGILDASKHRHNSLWRSKSETNLKSPERPKKTPKKDNKENENNEQPRIFNSNLLTPGTVSRPKSWSPDDATSSMLFSSQLLFNGVPPVDSSSKKSSSRHRFGTDPSYYQVLQANAMNGLKGKACCENSEILTVDVSTTGSSEVAGMTRVSSVKDRISELESQAQLVVETPKSSKTEAKPADLPNKAGLVLNLATQFESVSKPGTPSPVEEGITMTTNPPKGASEVKGVNPVVCHTKPPIPKHQAVLVKPVTWDQESSTPLSQISSDQASQVQASDTNKQSLARTDACAVTGDSSGSSRREDAKSSTRKQRVEHTKHPCLSACNKSPPSDKKVAPPQVRIPSQTLSQKDNPSPTICSSSSTSSAGMTEKSDSVFLWSRQSSCSSCGAESPPAQRKQAKSDHTEHLTESEQEYCSQRELFNESSPLRETSKANRCFDIECLDTGESNFSQDNNTSKEFLYEKEAIPWTPGTVLRTKQQIEEKNLKRTSSFDSAFPPQSQSTPSTPPEVSSDSDGLPMKTIQRSHSFRSDGRPSSMLIGGKWYPLPALASPTFGPFRNFQAATSTPSLEKAGRVSMPHSVSTPSVVEAVNKVLCGTQEVLNSAIQSLPNSQHCNNAGQYSPVHKNTFEFCVPTDNIPSSDSAFSSKCTDSKHLEPPGNPPPGTVRQHKEALENLNIKNSLIQPSKDIDDENKTKRDQMKLIREYGRSLVPEEAAIDADAQASGVVKRLTKELEAKTGSGSAKKDRVIIIDKDGKELTNQQLREHPTSEDHTTTLSNKLGSAPSSPNSQPRSPPVLAESSADKEANCSCKTRTLSDSQVESKVHILERHHQSPITPQRRESFDIECLKKLSSPSSPHFVSKQPTTPTPSQTLSGLPATKPPPASKSSVLCSAVPPPPPPPPTGSLQRKVRKLQQGKSHPLSKLAVKQRHANPLYNTM